VAVEQERAVERAQVLDLDPEMLARLAQGTVAEQPLAALADKGPEGRSLAAAPAALLRARAPAR
jgi:hypothetical protein